MKIQDVDLQVWDVVSGVDEDVQGEEAVWDWTWYYKLKGSGQQ